MITARTVDRLTHFEANGLPVVSAYLAHPKEEPARERGPHSRVSALLHDLRQRADDETLSRDARLSLRGDIDRIEDAASATRWRRGAVALFSCSRSGLFELLELPRPVRDRIVVDRTPWTRPMLALLEESHRACVVVLDKATARLWEYYQRELVELDSVRDPILRKHNYAGWGGYDEKHVSDKAAELAKKHYRRVADLLEDVVRSGAYDAVVVGGHPEEFSHFVDQLPDQVRSRVAGDFAVDLRTVTIGEVKQATDKIMERYERDAERRLVEDVLGTAAAGGMATVGVEPSLWAGSVAAIERLLVEDDATMAGVVCEQCGWLGLSGDVCPVSGDGTRQSPDVVGELAESVIDNSGSVNHVLADTPLRGQTLAAALRFPLPPDPTQRG